MKSKESLINELLNADSEVIRASIPLPFYNRLLAAGRRKFGTLQKNILAPKALVNAAALGLIFWEKELNAKSRSHSKKAPTPAKGK